MKKLTARDFEDLLQVKFSPYTQIVYLTIFSVQLPSLRACYQNTITGLYSTSFLSSQHGMVLQNFGYTQSWLCDHWTTLQQDWEWSSESSSLLSVKITILKIYHQKRPRVVVEKQQLLPKSHRIKQDELLPLKIRLKRIHSRSASSISTPTSYTLLVIRWRPLSALERQIILVRRL